MVLQVAGDFPKLVVDLRHHLFELRNIQRRANAGHDVLALRVDQKFAVKLLLAR